MQLKHNSHLTNALLASTALFAARPAAPATVVFSCSGTIGEGGVSEWLFDSTVHAGTPFSATFSINSPAVQDLASADPNSWDYIDHNSLNEAYIQFGDYSMTPEVGGYALNSVTGTNDAPYDQIEWGSDNMIGGGLVDTSAGAILEDRTGTAITGKGLPPPGPGLNDISRWDSTLFVFFASKTHNGPRGEWWGNIDSISTHIQENPVPEPGSLALLAMAGIPGLGLVARKARR